MKYKKITINDKFQVEVDLESGSFFVLRAGQLGEKDSFAFNLNMSGVEIGELSEKFAYPVKSVLHEFMDSPGYIVETESVIPFGTEPKIKRKFEILPGIIQITDDIRVHPATIENGFKVDSINIKGDWTEFALPDLHNTSSFLEWKSFSTESEVLYNSEQVCPILLLKNERGMIFELGTGFDVWRWQAAELYSLPERNIDDEIEYPKPVSHFKVTRQGDTVTVEREVLKADCPFPVTSKNWRFNWYVAWSESEDIQGSCSDSEKNVVHLDLGEMPTCFHARKNKKLFKNKVRMQLKYLNENTLQLDCVSPGLCKNPSHVARSSKEHALHWDLGDLIDLWFWANRQLISSNSDFVIRTDENSWFSELPSYLRISQKLF